jgi:unsaturated chondroitin disaccharide hydrolase
VDYDPDTGAVLKKQTVQGFADPSSWARGQSWGLYGYTRMYALTKNPAYLAQARKVADFLIHHPRLPKDGIPYWDFDVPHIPDALRDVAAGAVMCSALFDLADLVGQDGAPYRAVAERQLRTLCTAQFRAGLGENGHFLLMHGVGHLPEKSEVDVPLMYADYYFLEALAHVSKK